VKKNTFVIKVERVKGSTGAVSFDWAISGGTATAGIDYSATNGVQFFRLKVRHKYG
jgi:hypothetical protein